jgi:hypothetical protein
VPAAAILTWRIYRRRRLTAEAPSPVQVRLFPEGFGQRDGIGPMRLRPWVDRYELTLGRNFNGRYALRLCWRYLGIQIHTPIDFEFESTPPAVDRIRQHIQNCRDRSEPR